MDARHALVILALLSMTSAQAMPTIARGPAPGREGEGLAERRRGLITKQLA